MPHNHLILVADAASARIFELSPLADGLRLVHSWSNGDGRRRTRELVADRMGYKARLATGWLQSVTQPTDPARREEQRFAKALSCHLDRLLGDRPNVHLTLLCSPRFLGELRRQLSVRVRRCVDAAEAVELSGFNPVALEQWLRRRRQRGAAVKAWGPRTATVPPGSRSIIPPPLP
ncbi:MAG: host attachment protein [Myxococcota bacterium]